MQTAISPLEEAYADSAYRRVWHSFRGVSHLHELAGEDLQDVIRHPQDGRRHELTGFTFFFRHQEFMETLLQSLTPRTDRPIRILAAPSSIGCEAYTLSALALKHKFNGAAGFQIDAFDVSSTFTDIARRAIYPTTGLWYEDITHAKKTMIADMPPEDADAHGLPEYFRVRADVADHVRILDAQSFENFVPEAPYDAVMVNNLFMYMNEPEIRKSLQVVESTQCDVFAFVYGEHRYRMGHYRTGAFVPLSRSPAWAHSPLMQNRHDLPEYTVWTRNDAYIRPVA